MRPPPLDDDVNESFGWCCDEFFGAFSNVQFSLSIGNNFYHHTFTSSSSSAHRGERKRERERERDARNHRREEARVDFFISDVFFETRAMSSGLCRIDDAETTTTTKRTD